MVFDIFWFIEFIDRGLRLLGIFI